LRDATIPSTTFRESDSAQRRADQGRLPEFFLSVGYRW
jgi:hypothetical protein